MTRDLLAKRGKRWWVTLIPSRFLLYYTYRKGPFSRKVWAVLYAHVFARCKHPFGIAVVHEEVINAD